MAILYRGFSNIHELHQVLINNTAGGLVEDTLNRNWNNYNNYLENQRAISGERQHRVVYMRPGDHFYDNRQVIEYSRDRGIAFRFGILGMLSIDIDDQYCRREDLNNQLRIGEQGVFCFSDAPIRITEIILRNNYLDVFRRHNVRLNDPDATRIVVNLLPQNIADPDAAANSMIEIYLRAGGYENV